ncbi:hypothetical protein PI124_g14812 [Phytophthora idaei]|nr:hypothetical protein PI125_g10231 [Phytophthora idaei]KAG3154844.1 hypothetical protein PI126_g9440 [Phytophthora idaei]KAG3240289.1 hypothetical protein PI124_g14812 [Phytophthora idaei]
MVAAVQPQQKYDDGEYNEEFAMACGYQDGQSREPYGPFFEVKGRLRLRGPTNGWISAIDGRETGYGWHRTRRSGVQSVVNLRRRVQVGARHREREQIMQFTVWSSSDKDPQLVTQTKDENEARLLPNGPATNRRTKCKDRS